MSHDLRRPLAAATAAVTGLRSTDVHLSEDDRHDLLATAVYPRLTDTMAMKIGSTYRFTEVQAPHWERFAVEADLSPAQVKKRVLHIAQRLPTLAQT